MSIKQIPIIDIVDTVNHAIQPWEVFQMYMLCVEMNNLTMKLVIPYTQK